jgi:hypothetical protein
MRASTRLVLLFVTKFLETSHVIFLLNFVLENFRWSCKQLSFSQAPVDPDCFDRLACRACTRAYTVTLPVTRKDIYLRSTVVEEVFEERFGMSAKNGG